MFHSNNPKYLIFLSWPFPPQIWDAVDQLNFFFPIHTSNNIIFILYNIFDPVPGGKADIKSLVKRIDVLIPIIIWRKFGQMLLPAPGWHILKLKIDELKIEVAFFDTGCAVSHWIDGVRCRRCRRRCRRYLFNISICRILWQSWTGRGAFVSEAWCNREQEFYYELLLDFQQRILISCWIFGKGLWYLKPHLPQTKPLPSAASGRQDHGQFLCSCPSCAGLQVIHDHGTNKQTEN